MKSPVKKPQNVLNSIMVKKQRESNNTLSDSVFIPRGSVGPVISGVVRSIHVQAYTKRPLSAGTKAYREIGYDR